MLNPGTLSRFRLTETIIIDGKETFGLWKPFTFTELSDLNNEDIITVKINNSFAGRPDLIAQKYYGSPSLEWIVIMSNKPQNPLGWPRINEIVRLPISRLVKGA